MSAAKTEQLVAALSDAQKARFKAAFDKLDADSSGNIDSGELMQLMKALGQTPTEAEVEAILNDFDTDRDGQISYPEFLGMIATQISNTEAEVHSEIFKALCPDGSGLITFEMLKAAVSAAGGSYTDAQIRLALYQADTDEDGGLNEAELAAVAKAVG